MIHRYFGAAAIAVSLWSFCRPGRADEACRSITRQNLVRCTLSESLLARGERISEEAAEARVRSARPFLPANPTLSGTIARRGTNGIEPAVTNWSATLSQELEIAGQRGASVRAAQNEVAAQKQRIVATEREAVAYAWRKYFDALGERDDLELAQRMEKLGALFAQAARARAERGVISTVEADVAEAAQLRLLQDRSGIERRYRAALAALATLVGADPGRSLGLEGSLEPLDIGRRDHAPARPEIAVARAEKEAFSARASAYRRMRVPHLTVSVFAQNDGYNENVLGAGLGLPIPLPGLGKTFAGEIDEAEALSQRASNEAERLTREARLELTNALTDYESRRTELAAFSKERLDRAARSLADIGTEIEAGRLAIRDALFSQERLIELLRSYIRARHALCWASVEVLRAAGAPLEKGAP